MLWRSFRAVLRKESWIFCCAGFVSIADLLRWFDLACAGKKREGILAQSPESDVYNTALAPAFQLSEPIKFASTRRLPASSSLFAGPAPVCTMSSRAPARDRQRLSSSRGTLCLIRFLSPP